MAIFVAVVCNSADSFIEYVKGLGIVWDGKWESFTNVGDVGFWRVSRPEDCRGWLKKFQHIVRLDDVDEATERELEKSLNLKVGEEDPRKLIDEIILDQRERGIKDSRTSVYICHQGIYDVITTCTELD
jgi:hypothetical protein